MKLGGFVFIWTYCLATPAPLQFCGSVSVQRLYAYDNKKVSRTQMWKLTARDIYKCIEKCLERSYCVSVHYLDAEKKCLAMRERFEGVTVDTADAPGYLLFQITMPTRLPGCQCIDDMYCLPLPNAHCDSGVCTCNSGYDSDGIWCKANSAASCTKLTVLNHSFETDGYWVAVMDGWTIDTLRNCIGRNSAQVINGGAYQEIWFSTPVRRLVVSGYGKNVDGPFFVGNPSDFSLYCDLQKESKVNIFGIKAPFIPGKREWNRATVNISMSEEDAFVRARCYVLYRNIHRGEAFFDNIVAYLPQETQNGKLCLIE